MLGSVRCRERELLLGAVKGLSGDYQGIIWGYNDHHNCYNYHNRDNRHDCYNRHNHHNLMIVMIIRVTTPHIHPNDDDYRAPGGRHGGHQLHTDASFCERGMSSASVECL